MRILGKSEDYYYTVKCGHGANYENRGPYYSVGQADQIARSLMTENIRKPMKNRTWVSVQKNGKNFRYYQRIADEVWKELPVA